MDTDDLRRPTDAALTAATDVARRLKRRTAAPIRLSFVRRPDSNTSSVLAQTLRGGQGGVVRLKLLLSFLWFASGTPHTLAYPARAWATLLGLPDPDTRGTRRVNDAVVWLEAHHLIEVENRAGRANLIRLLREDGSGQPYIAPATAYRDTQNAAGKRAQNLSETNPHRYLQLPNTTWTNGWIEVLSAAGLAMLLVLLSELGGKPFETTDLWLSPTQSANRYGLSEDSQTKGLRELRRAGLITTRRQSINRDVFDFRRLRNVYRLDLLRLDQPAAIPPTMPDEHPGLIVLSPDDIFGPAARLA